MLAPSGGGLILYQAYGNLYAMTGRKAHLLEDKQIPSVGVFDEVVLALGWHLEEIHVTWAHLEKKLTSLWSYTKSLEKLVSKAGKKASDFEEILGSWLMYITAIRQDIAFASFVVVVSRRECYGQTPQRDDCKSTSGGLQFLGEKLVIWSSKKQDCTAMSTAEAEYVSIY
ncbi:hypothetical protein Tco_0132439 [Tanacetum coccineum]